MKLKLLAESEVYSARHLLVVCMCEKFQAHWEFFVVIGYEKELSRKEYAEKDMKNLGKIA